SQRHESMNHPPPPPDEHEELVHADDTIIGKAVRWSLVAVLVIAVVVIGFIFIVKRKPAPPPPRVTQLSAPAVPAKPKAEIPAAPFTDITREAGITFLHNNGAYGDKLLPETMGGGVAFFDFDNDGAPDLLFVNSTYWPWHARTARRTILKARFHNSTTMKATGISPMSPRRAGSRSKTLPPACPRQNRWAWLRWI